MPRFSFCVLTISLAFTAFAQTQTETKKAAAKVDKVLRARVDEFLQDHVTGAFDKAYELVAEDSRNRFLSLGKEQVSDPKISGIEYTDHFTKARVTATVVRKASMGLAGVRDIPSSRTDSWKLEKGKWVWYFDPTLECVTTLIGALPCTQADLKARNDSKNVKVPEKITPEALAERMKQINKASGFDGPGIRLIKGVAGSGEIHYHNGLPGQIRVSLEFTSNSHDGYVLEPSEPVMLDAYRDLTIKVTTSDSAKVQKGLGLRMFIDPFSSLITIPIQFLTPEEAKANASTPPTP